MKMKLRALSDNDISLVHEKTVQILEEAGLRIMSKRAREALLVAGAIAGEGEIIKIPESLLNKCLDLAPSTFVLGARNPIYDVKLPAERPGHLTDGTTTSIFDLETGKRRESTKADVMAINRVFHSLESGTVAWAGCSALDKPAETHCLHEFAGMLQGTSKHIQFELRHKGESPYVIEILRAVLGSDEAIRERKIASMIHGPVSPLAHEESMLDAYLELAEYDIPVCAYPCPVMGLTSPASVFSTICQINAETLSTLVIFQVVRPGIPFIYGSCSGSMDRVTGDYVDGEECVLLSMGAVEMARHYGLPCEVGGCDFETMSTYLMWPDLLDGFGTVDDGMTSDMELMVVQDEIAKRIYRIIDGIDTGKDKDLTEDIIKLGPGGSFLGCKSTRKMIRDEKELYYSKLFPDSLRHTYGELEAMRKIANQYLKDLFAAPIVDEIPKETQCKIDGICDRADRELAGV